MIIEENKGNSGFVRPAEAQDGEIIVILDPGREVKTPFFKDDGSPKYNHNFAVNYKGKECVLSMNWTSQQKMKEVFGNDTEDWVGKCAKILVLPTPDGKHKMIILCPEPSQTVETPKPEVQEEW